MNPQEGDIADLPDGRTATFTGGQWVIDSGWNIQPMQTPADARAEANAARAEAREDRLVANDERSSVRASAENETQLRREFLGLPDVKEFGTVRASYQNVIDTASNESAAGDLSLIFAFMKMLDPNSVVREQEFANAQNAAGVPEQVRNLYNRAISGVRLSPEQRTDFMTQAESIYGNRLTQYNQTAERYRSLATDYGFEPDRVALPGEAIDLREQDGTQPGDVTSTVEDTTESPNQLSRQGYTYDPGKQSWVRTTQAEVLDARQGMNPIARRIDAGVRGVADVLTIGYADEIAAAGDTLFGGGTYEGNLELQRGIDQLDAREVPFSRGAGQVAGAFIAPGAAASARYVASAPSMLSAVGRNAAVGGAYGAAYGSGGAEGGMMSRVEGAREGGATGAMIGGGLGATGRVAGNVVQGMMTGPRAQAVRTLDDNGVFMTPGQRMGGLVGNVEDLAQRAPILGPAIRGARDRSYQSLNRAVGNRSLDAIGEGVPADVAPGGDMVGFVRDRLGGQFERAYSMVPDFTPDDALIQGLQRIGASKTDLPPDMQRQFDTILGERMARLDGAAGGQVGVVREGLQTQAAGFLRSQDPDQQALGRMLMGVVDELDAGVGRLNPEAGQILSQARDGYADYIRMERASTSANSQPFTPNQLSTAVRTTDGSVRKGAVGRGDARMQDLSSAAQEVLPGNFGNPGTADAVGLGGLGVGMLNAPITTTAVAGGLTAAATPYFAMGRKVVERLPANASRQQLESALGELDGLARQDTNVVSLRDEVARRVARATPAAAQQGNLMTGTR